VFRGKHHGSIGAHEPFEGGRRGTGMGDLPFPCGKSDEEFPIVIDAHGGGRQHGSQAVGNEFRPAISPDADGAVRRAQINADDHFKCASNSR
jgi:hypothetical protein